MLFKRLIVEEAKAKYVFPTELYVSLEYIEQMLGVKLEFILML